MGEKKMNKKLITVILFLAAITLSACNKEKNTGYSASYETIQAGQSEDVNYQLIKQNVIYKDADNKNVVKYNKISGEKAGEMKVVLGTDSEDVAYSESDNWSRELEIYTFAYLQI